MHARLSGLQAEAAKWEDKQGLKAYSCRLAQSVDEEERGAAEIRSIMQVKVSRVVLNSFQTPTLVEITRPNCFISKQTCPCRCPEVQQRSLCVCDVLLGVCSTGWD